MKLGAGVVGALATVFLLGACSNLSRTLEPQPIFPPPSEAVDISQALSGSDGNVCTTTPAMQNRTRKPPELVDFAVTMVCAYNNADGTSGSTWLKRFVEKGLALSDQTCQAFFVNLESRRVEASYAQTNYNVLGTAVTAVLAATDHHRRSIFNVATALTAGNAWFENYKSNYVLTPQLRKLHDKIQTDLRDPIRVQIEQKSKAGGYASFDEAKRDLMRYDSLCSHMVIYDVVNDSVAKAEIRTFAPAANPELDKVVSELHAAASGGPGAPGVFGPGELEALYVVATTPDSDRPAAAAALAALDPSLNQYLANLGFLKGSGSVDVLAAFRQLGSMLALDKDAHVADMRIKIAAQMQKMKDAAAKPPAAPLADAGPPAAPTPSAAPSATAQRDFAATKNAGTRRSAPAVNFKWEVTDHSRR